MKERGKRRRKEWQKGRRGSGKIQDPPAATASRSSGGGLQPSGKLCPGPSW